MSKHRKIAGFQGPEGPAPAGESRRVVIAELAAVAGLTIATVIAVTAVSVGIARASVVDGIIDNDGTLFTVALLLGLAFIAVGGLSLFPGARRQRH